MMYSKLPKFYRNVLALAIVVSAVPHGVNAQKPQDEQKPVYVIVHGAWGGSWAFRKVDSLLTAAGAVVYRPSLTGLGERVHLASPGVNLTTHITDVVNTILFEDLRGIILVGHSYGGMVITGVADALPERIQRLIYLDAMIPHDGENVVELMDPDANGLLRMTRGDYVIPAWVKPDQKPPKDVPHPLKTFTERIVLKDERAKKIPGAYILTVDAGKKPEEDDFAAFARRAAARGWPKIEMQADHNPQWSAPEELVRQLLELR